MVNLTSEQKKGNQFEIFLEELVKKSGFVNVLRNVEFKKEKYCYRQADLFYQEVLKEKKSLTSYVLEAKYSSNGTINYNFRNNNPKIKRSDNNTKVRIHNLIDEILERHFFIGANYSILATNKGFEKKLIREAKHKGIALMDGNDFQRIYKKLGGKGDFEDYIRNIRLNPKQLYKNVIRI
jgi:hypothetical protein